MNWYKKSRSYNGIFDMSTTGTSYYDQLMSDEVFADEEDKYAEVMFMSPDEYERRIATGFWNQGSESRQQFVTFENFFNNFVKSERANDAKLQKLLESAKGGSKFPLPIIEYFERGAFQEGHHRVKVAEMMGEKVIPVLVVNEENMASPIEDYSDEVDLTRRLERFLQYNQIYYAKKFFGIDISELTEFLQNDRFLERGDMRDKWEFVEANALKAGKSVIVSPNSEEGRKAQGDSNYAYSLALSLKEKFKSDPSSFVQFHNVDRIRVELEIAKAFDLEKFCKDLVRRLGAVDIIKVLRKQRDEQVASWGGRVNINKLKELGLDV